MKLATIIAQGITVDDTGLNETAGASGAGYGAAGDLPALIGNIIEVALGFVGFLAFAFILYAGFLWMTAGGNEENVTKAKTMMRNAVVGFIIISAAYAIVNFVITSLP